MCSRASRVTRGLSSGGTIGRDKIGRNEACPCGSGKKYKRCCLKLGKKNPYAANRHVSSSSASGPPAEPVWPTWCTQFDPDSAETFALGGPRADTLHPWVLAQIRDRLQVGPSGRAPRHTISSVRRLDTDRILRSLERSGVSLDAERFRSAAEGRRSAWEISEQWPNRGRMEAERLGLFACELWRRFLPDRPSYEMIDERIQEGYLLLEREGRDRALRHWIQCWHDLLDTLPEEIDSLEAADEVFPGLNSLVNWTWDFDIDLMNAALEDEDFARRGLDLFDRLVSRFTGVSRHKRTLEHVRIEFLYSAGRYQQGEEALLAMIRDDPEEAGPYAWLSDQLIRRGNPPEYRDVPRALALLEDALARPMRNPEEYDLENRIEFLRDKLKEEGS